MDAYTPEHVLLYETIYGENLISLGGFDAIDNMFSDLNINGLKALDIGFGLGGVAFYLAKKYQMEVAGVEIQPWMVQHAQHHAPNDIAHLVTFTVYNENGELPFDSASFDLVYSKGVLNHVHEKENLFRQIKEVLKPNGLFVIADWISPVTKIDSSSPLVNETKESYQQILENTGFKGIHFRNDSTIFKSYVKQLIERLLTCRALIEKKYGAETFTLIWDNHQNLLQELTHQQKMATRIIAKK